MLIEDKNTKIKITGIRPLEKMHEILISEEEIHHCEKRGEYYAILSTLPELQGQCGVGAELTKEYSSNDEVLDLNGTVELLKKHGLLNIDSSSAHYEDELLR